MNTSSKHTSSKSTARHLSALTGRSQDALTALQELSPKDYDTLAANARKAAKKLGGYPPMPSRWERFLDKAEAAWEWVLLLSCRKEFWIVFWSLVVGTVLLGVHPAGLGAGR